MFRIYKYLCSLIYMYSHSFRDSTFWSLACELGVVHQPMEESPEESSAAWEHHWQQSAKSYINIKQFHTCYGVFAH